MNSLKPNACILLLIFLPFLTSCSLIQKITKSDDSKSVFIKNAIQQAESDIAAGRYLKALDIYSDAFEIYQEELNDSFLDTADHIKKIADNAYRKKNYTEAGTIYFALLSSGVHSRRFKGSLSFNENLLNIRIKACSTMLMEDGLAKYREEKLGEAIAIWKAALTFDPGNISAAKAVDTASRQLKQLKNLK